MTKYFVLTLLCLSFLTSLQAQYPAPNNGQAAYEISNYSTERYAGIGHQKLEKKFSIACYVFLDSATKSYNITDLEIQDAISKLNQNFAKVGFQFEICEITYHENFQYNSYRYQKQTYEPMVLFNKKNAINLFLASSVIGTGLSYGTNEGFASMPVDEFSYIYMNKLALTSSESITHLMGHYFGLFNTSESSFGLEYVDPRRDTCYFENDLNCRCRTTGDLMCDTRADRFFYTDNNYFTSIDDQCKFDPPSLLADTVNVPNNLQDRDTTWIEPPMDNFMSDYWSIDNDCRDNFSPGQMRKMYLEVTNPNSRIYRENW
jgi:hypothetical protein